MQAYIWAYSRMKVINWVWQYYTVRFIAICDGLTEFHNNIINGGGRVRTVDGLMLVQSQSESAFIFNDIKLGASVTLEERHTILSSGLGHFLNADSFHALQ